MKNTKIVDVVWNMQPVKGDINIDKSNYHPYDYFMGNIPEHEYGKDSFKEYKEVPTLDSQLWKDYKGFIDYRKTRSIELMKQLYDITIYKTGVKTQGESV